MVLGLWLWLKLGFGIGFSVGGWAWGLGLVEYADEVGAWVQLLNYISALNRLPIGFQSAYNWLRTASKIFIGLQLNIF